ncbi:DUF2252 family protein [Bacillus cereus]
MGNQHTPLQTLLEGDAHAQNVAIFDDCEGTLRFDVTDFKNSYNGLIQKQMEKMKLSYTYEEFLKKTTLLQNGKHIFLPNDPSFVPLRTEEQEDFTKGWNEYIKSIASFADKKPEGYFMRKDVVHKQNSSVGSVGRDIFYVLLEGDTAGPADDIVLEVKEQQLPATLATGMKVDSYLGTLYTQGRSYSVKKLSPWYYEFESADFRNLSDVEEFVQYAAKAFARMHARADLDYNPAYVPHHFAENALVFMK